MRDDGDAIVFVHVFQQRSTALCVWIGALRLQHFTQLFHVYTLEGHGYILV